MAGAADMDALCAVQGERLVVLLGGVADPRTAASVIVDLFGDGPVVAGPVAADLGGAAVSARAAVSAYRASPGWPGAPRPVLSVDLLAERALGGDGHARRMLVDEVYLPLLHARGTLVETLTAWLDGGSSIEGAARALFVHPNTVRYRLRRIHEVSGYSPTDPRDAYALRLSLTLGRLLGNAPPKSVAGGASVSTLRRAGAKPA